MYHISMDWPDISTYPDNQRNAIEKAKTTGNSIFQDKDVSYLIERVGECYKVMAYSWDREIWYCTWRTGTHYGLQVHPDFQGQGIGKILLSVKHALDGILETEWSSKFSKILFLLKLWYMPIAHMSEEFNLKLDYPLEADAIDIIKSWIKAFYARKTTGWNGDSCPFAVRLKRDPLSAEAFLASLGL